MITNENGSITFKNKAELKTYIKRKEADTIKQYRVVGSKPAVNVVIDEANELLTLMIYEVLHVKFGFGKKRLTTFRREYDHIVDCWNQDLLEVEDLKEIYVNQMDLEV